MTTSTKTAISWKSVLFSDYTNPLHLTKIRDALLHTFNDSLLQFRQALREIVLLYELDIDRPETIELFHHIQRHGFFLSDPRVKLYVALLNALQGKECEYEIDDALLEYPTLEGVEYAFLLMVLGVLSKNTVIEEKGVAFLEGVVQFGLDFPHTLGVDLSEYEYLTPEGILAVYNGRETVDYPGRVENVQALRCLAARVESLPQVSPIPLKGVSIERIAGGVCAEGSYGKNTGFFSYMKEGLGVLTMGPSFFPLCEQDSFGIIPCGHASHCASFQKIFSNGKVDIGWLHWEKEERNGGLFFTLRTIAPEEIYPFALCLLLRSDEVTIEGKTTIHPKSLEKYQSVASNLHCKRGKNNFRISPDHQGEMQVIPLAGGAHFFGADFLVAFVIERGREKITLEMR